MTRTDQHAATCRCPRCQPDPATERRKTRRLIALGCAIVALSWAIGINAFLTLTN